MKTKFEEVAWAARIFDNSWQHTVSNETCVWCDKEKITSGIFIEYNFHGYNGLETTGSPCCQECYRKIDGFDEWYSKTENCNVPRQVDWFIELFCKEFTPAEAVETVAGD